MRFCSVVFFLIYSFSAFAGDINLNIEPLQPLLRDVHVNTAKVALGDKLFHENKLSGDNSISCAHCHNLDSGGADGLPLSFGVSGREGDINSPTVFNSSLSIAQFWDGRAATLEDQIEGPLHALVEMDSNWPDVIKKLSHDPTYTKVFSKLYQDGITATNIKDAIAEFERSLITSNSRFDRWLLGEEKAITEDEKKGYQRFKSYGCVACHQGANVGGNMFQLFGVMDDYFANRKAPMHKVDFGRFNVTKNEFDKHVFKVPSLRMVVLTAPYFHDGSVEDLHKAVKVMARYQLGREISDEDIDLIEKFLHTLVGEYQGQSLEPTQ
ncbi:MAG: cytochrome-c peroxidase [Mariprofundaceae bacterium]